MPSNFAGSGLTAKQYYDFFNPPRQQTMADLSKLPRFTPSTTGNGGAPALTGRNVFVGTEDERTFNPFFLQVFQPLAVSNNGNAQLSMGINIPNNDGNTYLAVAIHDYTGTLVSQDIMLTLGKNGTLVNRLPIWNSMRNDGFPRQTVTAALWVQNSDPDSMPSGFNVPNVQFAMLSPTNVLTTVLAFPFRISQDINQIALTASILNTANAPASLAAGMAAFTL